jgi:hypothetical protein
MNIEDENGSQNAITEQGEGGASMEAAGSSQGGSSRSRSTGGSHSRSASGSRSGSHSGKSASGAATDKEAQRRGGQNSHSNK